MVFSVDLSWGYYTDFIGIILCLITAYLNIGRLKVRTKKNRILLALLCCVMLSCICNSTGIWVDGKAGSLYRTVNYAVNTWLFLACIINGILWVMFIEDDIHGENSQAHIRTIQTISLIGILLLIVNLYLPIVFAVNGNGVYERKSLFWVYFAIQICFLLDAILMYMIAKYKFGGLSVVVIWAYLIPLMIGMMVQYHIYGVSLIWPSAAVSTCIFFVQLNADDKYKDRLTGLYRYDYIPVLEEKLGRFQNNKYTLIIIQIMGLGSIKVEHGNEAEDDVRRDIATLLQIAVKPKGVICQCENDAYAVVFNTTDETVSSNCVELVKKEFEEYCEANKMSYSLTSLVKTGIVDVKEEDMEERISQIRENM